MGTFVPLHTAWQLASDHSARWYLGRIWPSYFSTLLSPHLVGEALHEYGHQQVEQNVVAEGHEGHEVEGGPVGGPLHAGEQHNVPVLLGQHLAADRVRQYRQYKGQTVQTVQWSLQTVQGSDSTDSTRVRQYRQYNGQYRQYKGQTVQTVQGSESTDSTMVSTDSTIVRQYRQYKGKLQHK